MDDPRDLNSLQRAVNDSAGKAAVLWTSFITLGTYLLIATGSVKHRDLFLDAPIKLPVLGVDLPVTGYFLVAPIIFLVFHFYVLLQLEGLSQKVSDYNSVLGESVKLAADRRLIRRRLDDFPFLQFLAGVRERRTGVAGMLQIVISWITLVMFPVVVFLQIQLAFLPYHSTSITWLHRICLICDLGLIWFFWPAFRPDIEGNWRRRALMAAIGCIGTFLLLIFSVSLATFPGEAVYRNAVSKGVDALVSLAFRDESTSASRVFFEGDVDGVTGHPSSLFANRIILPGERFYDETKHEKAETSVSLRGRDLRGAVMPRSDLRLADFTGATLLDASFVGAKLQRARFGCAAKLLLEGSGRLRSRARADACDDERAADLRGADFSEAILQGAFFNRAKLRGARFARSMMQGMSVDDADLTGATLTYARMEGASLVGARLDGASLFEAQMQGVDVRDASLANATLFRTQLQGANLLGADLSNATLRFANLYRAFVKIQDHEETIFIVVHANPSFPRIRLPSQRKERTSQLAPKQLDAAGYKILVNRVLEGIQGDEIKQSVAARLQLLDPASKTEEDQLTSDKPIKSNTQANDRIRAQRVKAIGELMCDEDGAPYVARGFIYNGRILGMEQPSAEMADDPAIRLIEILRAGACPGALGLDVNDFRELGRTESHIRQIKDRRKGKNTDDDDDSDDNK